MGAEAVLVAAGWLWVALGAAGTDEPQVLSEVLFCQPDEPSLGLAVTLGTDELFWFNFSGSSWVRRLPELPPELPPELEAPELVLKDAEFCQALLALLTNATSEQLAQARGIPVAKLFPLQPPALGKPNTLVCLVENISPPAVDITWRADGVPVTRGVTHTGYTAIGGVTFTRFSYLRVTPGAGTAYSCVVTSAGLNSSTVAYWVAQEAGDTETLWTALCGAAMALGTVMALMGIAMVVVVAWRGRTGG
ncbi:class II histocompatibility antigen, M alpha chain [Neopsephotus bourkii]|uniref:class II histocompatibility antigen, M alpha chain n=1 Tax=Neopsephotus bourkii TaxID=309878 RepID=UPI002AA57CB0|nr:class II histocompatibility antigen, M alpha chain [Neopsephotus bourkii]